MSTNKTPNYNLHAWEPGDDFLRREFNENFAALDTAVHGGFTDLDSKISQTRTALDTSISQARTALETSIGETRTALDTKINGNYTALDGRISGNYNTLNAAISQNRASLDTVVNQNIPALNTSVSQINAALATVSRVVCGIYYGDGIEAGQLIDLGFRPLAVLVFYQDGPLYSNVKGSGLAIGDNASGTDSIVIVDNGFRVKTSVAYLNMNKGRYHYLAFH